MTGQNLACMWVENQRTDRAIYGGEGNSSNGVFVYQLRVDDQYTDAVGTADNAISLDYQTYHKTFGAPSREKYIERIELELNDYAGDVTVDVADLTKTQVSGIVVEKVPT